MHELNIRLKSGKDFNVFCKEYKIETLKLSGELVGFEYKDAHGEVPMFLLPSDIECIIEIVPMKESEGD